MGPDAAAVLVVGAAAAVAGATAAEPCATELVVPTAAAPGVPVLAGAGAGEGLVPGPCCEPVVLAPDDAAACDGAFGSAAGRGTFVALVDVGNDGGRSGAVDAVESVRWWDPAVVATDVAAGPPAGA